MKSFLITGFLFFACNSQRADMDYDTSVDKPAYTSSHPKVLFDEAHKNFHTSTGRYAPFVNLIRNDGYIVERNSESFTYERLSGYSVLVIANAKGKEEKYLTAFDESECEVVREWVKAGGSLLLIADHYPMGSAAQSLATMFGVEMSNGFVADSMNYEGDSKFKDQLVFSRQNGLLKNHPIIEGRNSTEQIRKVAAFTGQSLKGSAEAAVLLQLSSTAQETIPDSIWKDGGKTYTRFPDPISIHGRNQGLALNFGKGRVVVLGEAAMLTAQIDGDAKFGMNIPGNDNRQFALNIMRWLSRLY